MNTQKTPKLSKMQREDLKETKAGFKAEGGFIFYFPDHGVTVAVKPATNAQTYNPGLTLQNSNFAELAAAYVGTGDTFRKSIGAKTVLDRIYFSGESVLVPVACAMSVDVYIPDDGKLQRMLNDSIFTDHEYVFANQLKFQGFSDEIVSRTVALGLAQQFVICFL